MVQGGGGVGVGEQKAIIRNCSMIRVFGGILEPRFLFKVSSRGNLLFRGGLIIQINGILSGADMRRMGG